MAKEIKSKKELLAEARARFKEVYPDRTVFLGKLLIDFSLSGQPCDITFYESEPFIDVKINEGLSAAVMYGVGAQKLAEMFSAIKLSNGKVISLSDVWSINPMPKEGFSKESLQNVDMSKGDEPIGEKGETLREMIANTYHCKTEEDIEHYLRRFIAS